MIIKGAFGDLLKPGLKQQILDDFKKNSNLGFLISHEMVEDDIYFGMDMASDTNVAPSNTEPLPHVTETWWEHIWRETWGLLTAEETWAREYKPIIKWYRLHYMISRKAADGSTPLGRRFAFGWYDFDRDVRHYYVMPLNVIVAIGRHVYHQIAYKISGQLMERQRGFFFNQGFKTGYREAARDLDKAHLLGQTKRFFPFTATEAASSQHAATQKFVAHANKISLQMKEHIEAEVMKEIMKNIEMYVGVDPVKAKPYIMQFMNDPAPMFSSHALPASIKKYPPIEAGTPVGVNSMGYVYALTDSEIQKSSLKAIFGFAVSVPDSEGNVNVKTSDQTVVNMKALLPIFSTLEAKHED